MEEIIGNINAIMPLCHKNTKDNEVFRESISKYLSSFFLKSNLKSNRNGFRMN